MSASALLALTLVILIQRKLQIGHGWKNVGISTHTWKKESPDFSGWIKIVTFVQFVEIVKEPNEAAQFPGMTFAVFRGTKDRHVVEEKLEDEAFNQCKNSSQKLELSRLSRWMDAGKAKSLTQVSSYKKSSFP